MTHWITEFRLTDTFDHENNEYEPEEFSPTKYNIVINEVYKSSKFGLNDAAEGHYLIHIRLKKLPSWRSFYCEYFYFMESWTLKKKPEIAECIYLPCGTCIGIIKTIWIKLIQRTWKKIYLQRQEIISKRTQLSSLRNREIRGKWSSNCLIMPGLKGMLYYLSLRTSSA